MDMVACPFCDVDSPIHVTPKNCRRCYGSGKVPASVTKILRQIRASKLKHLGRRNGRLN
jgi:RecJ-like exonuclease